MSHLPLDARAILEYLNELGYRSISAEQLKEFMKGMQRHSEISSNKSKQQQKPKGSSSSHTQQQQQQQQNKLPSTATTTTPATGPSSPKQQQQQQQQQRTPVKIIKSKKPLCHFKFYLDICDHQAAKKIEIRIKQLGGTLEFFLTPSVTHFITDKTVLPPTVGNNNNNNTLSSRPGTPQTPLTPGTPQTPYSHESHITGDGKNNATSNITTGPSATTTPSGSRRAPVRQTRADAILNRARRGQSSTLTPIASPNAIKQSKDLSPTSLTLSTKCLPRVDNNSNQSYIVWQTEQALRFFTKVQHDLKDYLVGTTRERKSHSSKSAGAFGPTNLKGSFIKIESLKRNYRPYYQLFKKPTEWPKIELTREDGAFRLSPKKEFEVEEKRMTRKSRSRSSQRQHALPAQVQALKKNEAGVKSSAGQKAGSNTAGTCKQAKETSEKQCGVCEICKIEYDTLTIHLKTKDHEYFAKNPQNFIALDTLIQVSADVNKFLKEDNQASKSENNMELEEMEVEEHEAQSESDLARDPLEDNSHRKPDVKRCSTGSANDAQHSSPSPGVRERSKRITKGKHSSEKFQNSLQRTSSKSPKGTTTPKSSSPKKSTALTVNTNTANATAHSNAKANEESHPAVADDVTTPGVVTRKKQATTTSVYSPPIRAMLPPSSMYKVVDTIQDTCTPQRKLQGAEQAVGSPSIIVKFKKVRQPEICRLSGEADTFMFRKQQTSSELPTDLDRQTTSDNVRANNSAASSTSLDSSANDSIRMELESEKTESCAIVTNASTGLNKKAIAIAKRRKGKAPLVVKNKEAQKATKTATPSNKQRFPTAPIQPEVQLKNLRSSKGSIDVISTCPDFPNLEHATRRLTVPEATRKSSRTATAIVTAATTSSRLLRAAVEAAKKASSETGNTSHARIDSITPQTTMRRFSKTAKKLSVEKPVSQSTRNSRLSVVRMEDRMGERGSLIPDYSSKSHTSRAKKNNVKKDFSIQIEDDDDEEEDDDIDEDYDVDDDDYEDDDEEFTLNSLKRNKPTSYIKKLETTSRAKTREERAARRWNQRVQSLEFSDYLPEGMLEVDVDYEPPKPTKYGRRKVASKVWSPKSKKSQCDSKQVEEPIAVPTKKVILTSPPQRIFDISKSERIPKQHYAFERLPVSDLWYRVYTRQDTCGERYCEYYGSTNYRKLPYEMGPIPFDLTVTGNTAHCTLCQKSGKLNVEQEKAEDQTKIVCDIKLKNEDEAIVSASDMSSKKLEDSSGNSELQKPTQTYAHKHKKLHLLQRYRQEQHQLMLQKQQEQQQQEALSEHSSNLNLKCESKASTPERDRERAGSTHSNTSSCTVSSTATFNSKQKFRNKHLNKAAFLSLELPPRKSPREHASTLALVSCIIRQRQDSISKTNSETDEAAAQAPPASPLTPLLPIAEDQVQIEQRLLVKEEKPPTPLPIVEVRSPRATRPAAATPVEELRFATEISENVKRMRRGQNKYDHSPPIVLKTARASRGKCKAKPATISSLDRRSFKVISSPQVSNQNTILQDQRRRPRSLLLPSKVGVARGRRLGRPPKVKSSLPSVRKTGSKKGVLEFEMDATALRSLKTAMAPRRSTQQIEWEIDKYLDLAANDYDVEEMEDLLIKQSEELPVEISTNKPSLSTASSSSTTKSKKIITAKPTHKSTVDYAENTPPPTDYFSSDFDLYDLFTSSNSNGIGSEESQLKSSKIGSLSLYSSVALQNYFRKRKSLKSNRTGWPKAQKKKPPISHKHGLRKKIQFLQKIEQSNGATQRDNVENINVEEFENDAASTQDVVIINREHNDLRNSGNKNGVITPPDSEADDARTLINGNYGDDGNAEEEYLDAIDDTEMGVDVGDDECIPVIEEAAEDEDDGETMADSIEIERCCEMDLDADIDAAAEADIEADADEDDDEDEDEDDEDDESETHTERVILDNEVDIDDETTTMYMEQRNKHIRRSTDAISPSDLKHMSRNSLHLDSSTVATASLTSTPTTTTATANMLRGLRRTPVLLNGSLGSCISPSEKAGDNSDIFTVSSDGLDTDLDLSNSHTQYRTMDDEQQQQQQHETSCPHRTPKRKYDISKYAPNSKNSRTCAAEAATAAVKSLAISQFLKKEVRVTCRRLRPPFRRFRFRHLRKLIKYEEGLGVAIHQNDYFQNLFKRTTASYRAKIDKEAAERKQQETSEIGKKHYPCASKENIRISTETVSRRSQTKALHEHQKENRDESRKREKHVNLCSKTHAVQAKSQKPEFNNRVSSFNFDDVLKCAQQSKSRKDPSANNDRKRGGMQKSSQDHIRVVAENENIKRDKNHVTTHQDGLSARTLTAQPSTGTIIPRFKTQKRKTLGNDPVALYHYYQNEWKHFEKQIPGQDSRADLRWQIRNKLK